MTDFMKLNPFVAVVVVLKTGDEAPYLKSLQRQSLHSPYEIILVRGGNRSEARNLAITQSRSPLVAFIDSDCDTPSGWLGSLTGAMPNDENVAGIGGVSKHQIGSSSLEAAIDGVFSTFLGSLGSPSLVSLTKPLRRSVNALSLHNCIYRKAALLEIGGFDERFDLNEDTDISARLCEKGYRLILDRSVFVYHHRRGELRLFMLQFFWYGVGRGRSMLTSARCIDERILSFLIAFVLIILFAAIAPYFTLVGFGVYLLLVLGSSFAGAIHIGKVKVIPRMFALFLVEHFSYLIGLICGMSLGPWKKHSEHGSMLVSKYYISKSHMESTQISEPSQELSD